MTNEDDVQRLQKTLTFMFTPHALWVFYRTQQLARIDGFVSTGHLLLALLDATDCQATRALRELDIDSKHIGMLHELGLDIERPHDPGRQDNPATVNTVPLSLAYLASFSALRPTVRRNKNVTTGDQLLAAVTTRNSFAVFALREAGVSRRHLRAAVRRQLPSERSLTVEAEPTPKVDKSVTITRTLPHGVDQVWQALTDLRTVEDSAGTDLIDATRTNLGDGVFVDTLAVRTGETSEVRSWEVTVDEEARILHRRVLMPPDVDELSQTIRVEGDASSSTVELRTNYQVVVASRSHLAQTEEAFVTWTEESADLLATSLVKERP